MADDAPAAAACPASSASPPLPPLFERVGGMTALVNAVDVFYSRILDDPTLAPFFEGVEMSRQRTKQVQFLCYAFGGPGLYLGKSIAEAHERLIRERGVHRGHFWTVAQHLRESLEQLQVPAGLIEECIANIAPAASVFPEPGGAPVPGPEPVPAEGTPAAELAKQRAKGSAAAAAACPATADPAAAAGAGAAAVGVEGQRQDLAGD